MFRLPVKKSLRFSILPALLLTASTSALADAKVYPASFGVVWSGPDPVYSASAMGNPSDRAWMYVDLPVINDDLGSGIDFSFVRVLDRHFSSNVRCSINTVYWNNSTDAMWGYWGPNSHSEGSSNNQQVLSTGAATHGSSRHEYFSCAVPPTFMNQRSYLISYTVSE